MVLQAKRFQMYKIGRAFARPFTSIYSVVRLTCTPYPCATGLPGPCYHLQQDGGPCGYCWSVLRLSYQTTAVYWCSVLRTLCCLYSRRALQCILAEQPPLKYSHWSVLTFLRHPARILYIPASLRPPQHLFRCGAGCLFLLDVYIVHSSIQLCNSNNVFVCFLL